jgi:hypothetical protein
VTDSKRFTIDIQTNFYLYLISMLEWVYISREDYNLSLTTSIRVNSLFKLIFLSHPFYDISFTYMRKIL